MELAEDQDADFVEKLMSEASKVKVLMLGDSGAGKSHFLACLRGSDFETQDLTRLYNGTWSVIQDYVSYLWIVTHRDK